MPRYFRVSPFLLPALLAGAAIVLLLLSLLGPDRKQDSEAIAADLPASQTLIEQGRYLAIAGNCASCHTAPGGRFMAGGLPFETPFGTLYSTNITPDPATGIGSWSERDFLNAMRHGVRPGGEQLYPAFPYTAFTKLTNADVAALYAYFMSVPAVRFEIPANDLGFPFNQRALMVFWKALFFEPGSYQADSSRSQDWNRGAYLVEALAHCSACHSPRNALGAESAGLAMSGGEIRDRVGESGQHRPWSAPNLSASMRGLGLWSQEDLSAYLAEGRNDFLETFGPMNDVIMNSTRHLSAADIDAMSVYLKDLPAIEETASNTPSEETMGRGRTIYNLHCGTCHLPTGEGDPEMGPRLNRGSLIVQSDNPASMINAILYGPEPPRPALPPKWREPMEAFRYVLDDDDIAAVTSFVRNAWENEAGEVTAEQVHKQRVTSGE